MRDSRESASGRRWIVWSWKAAVFVAVAVVIGASSDFAVASTAGRVDELVSPPDKNGGEITLGAGSIRASVNGDAVVFDSNVASDDARGTGALAAVTFRSDRGSSAWTTRALMPPQAVNLLGLFNAPTFGWFAPDLSHGLLTAGDPALVSGAAPGVPNLYLTDGNGNPSALLTPVNGPTIGGAFNAPTAVDASSDSERVAFQSVQSLTGNAPFNSVYEWDHGVVHLASVLPDGTPAPDGAVAGPPDGAVLADTDQAFSEDGTRLYFTTPSDGRLYLRRDEASTAWVSQSEASSPDITSSTATFRGASADGKRAVFLTDEHLLDADQDSSTDLYLYTDSADPATDSNLTLLSQDHEPSDGSSAQVDGVIGMSRDGQRVYFVAQGQIVAGQPLNAQPKLYLWDHGNVRYITSLVSPDDADDGLNWSLRAINRVSRVSADGRYLLFTTAAPLDPSYDNAGHKEIYRYDADGGANPLVCVSCGPGSGPATADASINFPGAVATLQYGAYESRALSADGSRVFFNTAEALVPGDTNGKVDAYVWDRGTLALLSSGRSDNDSYFVDASGNGDDAFFVTRERLVNSDRDDLLDLYDARIGGGLPDPPTVRVPCAGESCQGPLAPVPSDLSPGSRTVVARGQTRPDRASATFGVGKLRAGDRARWRDGGALVVRVRVSMRGRVSARMRLGSRTLASTSTEASGPGTVQLALRLPATVRHQLLRRAVRVRVTVTVRFSGVSRVKRLTLVLSRPAGAPSAARGANR